MAAAVELRPPTADEMAQVGLIGSYVYGGAFGDGPDSVVATANRPEWMLCAFDGDRMAASHCTIPFTMRMNGRAVPLGGVSAVGTLPEYRRQGLVRRLVARSFEDMRDGGRPIAALWASQAAIYQRYGYAVAGAQRAYRVDTADISFADGDGGRSDVERHDAGAGHELAKAVYQQFVADRTGYLHRGRQLWTDNILAERDGDGPVHVAVSRRADGQPNAYAVYTLRAARVDHAARGQEIAVRDLAWLDLDGYRSLWSWFARHDLVGRVRWENAPVDDPAPELFSEPRMLHTGDGEGMWFRVVDVPVALAARGYVTDGDLAIGIGPDPIAPWNEGTWALSVRGGEATVGPPAGDADIAVSPKALSSLYTGSRTARRLAAWGLLQGSPEAVARADALFATHHAPHCPDHF